MTNLSTYQRSQSQFFGVYSNLDEFEKFLSKLPKSKTPVLYIVFRYIFFILYPIKIKDYTSLFKTVGVYNEGSMVMKIYANRSTGG